MCVVCVVEHAVMSLCVVCVVEHAVMSLCVVCVVEHAVRVGKCNGLSKSHRSLSLRHD